MVKNVQWIVTVGAATDKAVMKFLSDRGEGIEGLSNLVEKAVGAFVKDPSYMDRTSGITAGELNDMLAAEDERMKEKYSGITKGELNDMLGAEDERMKEKYSGVTMGEFNDMVAEEAEKKAQKK
jgi:hypothetical protein